MLWKQKCTVKGANIFGEVNGGFLCLSGKVLCATLLDSVVYVFQEGSDGDNYQEMPFFYADTTLKEVDGLDLSGKRYRTARRAKSRLEQGEEKIFAQVLCLLVTVGSHPQDGTARRFIVLGGLAWLPLRERLYVLDSFLRPRPSILDSTWKWKKESFLYSRDGFISAPIFIMIFQTQSAEGI
jgi:hypothetical protein